MHHILKGHLFNYQTFLQSSPTSPSGNRKWCKMWALSSGGLLSLVCEPDLYTNMYITGHHGGTIQYYENQIWAKIPPAGELRESLEKVALSSTLMVYSVWIQRRARVHKNIHGLESNSIG